MYKCLNCQETIEKLDGYFVRCPNCASRILVKQRAPIVKKVKAE